MELATIASGSSGNCVYAGSHNSHFLIDVGISRKRVVEGLQGFGVDPATLGGIFITHEHIDHIGGLGVFLRKYKIPVFATGRTIDKILKTSSLGKMDASLFHSIQPDSRFKVDDTVIEAHRIFHDAADPVCFTMEDEESKIGMVTDSGTFDDYHIEKLTGCESLLVESNHDLNMLMVGPYPFPLKRRIMGNYGHLSNERAGELLSKIIGEKTKHIYLGHLSKDNNYSDLAYETVKLELQMRNMDLEQLGISMQVASRNDPTHYNHLREERIES